MPGVKCSKGSCTRKEQTAGLCKPHYDYRTRSTPTGRVDTTKVIAHINRLEKSGVSQSRTAELSGLPQVTVWSIASGHRAFVMASTAAKIFSVPVPAAGWQVARANALISPVGSRRRVQALMAIGYPGRVIAEELNVHHRVVAKLSAESQDYVTARVARGVAEVFERLQMTRGPSEISRQRAARKGWHLPLSWDEDSIDNPDAEPQIPDNNADAWFDDYQDLRGFGLNDNQIAERWGILLESLRQRLRRIDALAG